MARTIFVGDVHGCADELGDLLDALRYAQGVDTLVVVGDLVARGPDSGAAVRRAAGAGAIGVRGNHDEKVLLWWRASLAHGRGVADRKIRLSERHKLAVTQMQDEDFVWLDALPLYLRFASHGAAVVHAGVDPRYAIERQEPVNLLHIRSVDEHNRPTRTLDGRPWASVWSGPEHIIFGHDARRALQLESAATGLDTGCCYGRSLTALVLQQGEPVASHPEARRAQLHSVKARAVHCPMGDGTGPE